jgi:3-methyladenine DNA glycosylase AlkD
VFGVSFASLRAIATEAKRDRALANRLWDTGNDDARLLAVANPATVGGAHA